MEKSLLRHNRLALVVSGFNANANRSLESDASDCIIVIAQNSNNCSVFKISVVRFRFFSNVPTSATPTPFMTVTHKRKHPIEAKLKISNYSVTEVQSNAGY